MPITKSAEKALRQNKTRKARNIIRKKAFREAVKDLRTLSLENKKEEASKLLPQVYKAIDKATKKGLLKKSKSPFFIFPQYFLKYFLFITSQFYLSKLSC